MRRAADDLGVGATFRLAPVGVVFGTPGEAVPDPFFGGAGPQRRGCLQCGECMTGCRHGAKNTLPTNYLYLAERAGARVVAETTVTSIRPRGDGVGGADHPDRSPRRRTGTVTAGQVVVAAGTWGTQELLHRMKADGTLPDLSDRLGVLTRTNSESLGGAATRWRGWRRRPDMTRGVAITSSVWLDDHTHLEPVRYGRGSNLMGLLSTVLTDGGGRVPRPLRWARQRAAAPGAGGLAPARPGQLVAAHGHRARHADRRGVAHGATPTDLARHHAADVVTRRGRAQPHLDPGRQRRVPPDGRAPRRLRGEQRSARSRTCR